MSVQLSALDAFLRGRVAVPAPEFCRAFGYSVDTLDRLCAKGELESVGTRAGRRILSDSIRKWITRTSSKTRRGKYVPVTHEEIVKAIEDNAARRSA